MHRPVQQQARVISVIPAGERWSSDSTLRPALEDLIGAGAVIHHLHGEKSPEAEHAERTYQQYQSRLEDTLKRVGSGIELIDKGRERDVTFAAQLNCSRVVPVLYDGAYTSV